MKPIEIEIKAIDSKGVATTYSTEVTPLKSTGGVVTKTIPKVAELSVTTTLYDTEYVEGYSAYLDVQMSLFLSEKIKQGSLQGEYSYHRTVAGAGGAIEEDYDGVRSFVGTNSTEVLLRDLDVADWKYLDDSAFAGGYVKITIKKIKISFEMTEWTYLPVYTRSPNPPRMSRSPISNLILRDGDG